jgi:hypothetical protein
VLALALLKKRYCDKWRPRKWLSLDVANVIIFISKMAKIGQQSRMCGVFFFSFSEKTNSPFCEIFGKKKKKKTPRALDSCSKEFIFFKKKIKWKCKGR